MADLKISAATPNPAPAGTDNFATDKAGVDFRTSLTQIAAFIGSGFGDVFKVGTPANNQLGVWTGDGTIEGTDQWQVVGAALQGVLGSGPELRNVAGVNIHPRKGDTDTGLASRGDNRLGLVAQGIDGIKLIGASSAVLQQHNTTVGLTAFATGGQTNATQLNSSYSVVDTVASPGDSVKFSTTLEVGVLNYVKNDGANAMDLFPAGGDDLGLGVGVPISVLAGKSVAFIGTVAGSTSTQFIFQEVSGDLTKVGTPLINQIAVWDGDGPVRGDPNFLLSGTQLILPSGTSAGLPELKVGPGQTGLFSGSSAQLRLTVNGIERFTFTNDAFQGFLAGSGQFHNRVSSLTIPTFTPNTNDDDTGIGGDGANQLALIAGGVAQAQVSAAGDAFFNAGNFGAGSGPGGILELKGGAGGATDGAGGNLRLLSGIPTTDGKGGDIFIKAADSIVSNNEGGDIDIFCGNGFGTANGGDMNLLGGAGGALGAGLGGAGGNVQVQGGSASGPTASGGTVGLKSGGATDGKGGLVEVIAGNSGGVGGAGGDVIIGSGIGAGPDDFGDISFKLGAAIEFFISDGPNSEFNAASFGGPAIRNRPASGTVPTLIPNKNDLDTGVGSSQDDNVTLIAGGIQALRIKEQSSGITFEPFADLSVTAFAGGGQSGFTLLNTYNVITTAASPGASVDLPLTFNVNTLCFIKNDGANSVDVFPSPGDDLGAGLNTAVSLPAGESISFIGTVQSLTWTPWDVSAAPAASGVVQTSITEDSAVATGTTIIPVDDTIPQITEGDEFMTVTHTPLNAANLLNITVGVYLEGLSRMSVALFEGVTANAIAAINHRGDDGDPKFMYFRTQIVAGGTGLLTFRVRAGSTGGTTTFNGIGGVRVFGGVMASNIYIEEVTP